MLRRTREKVKVVVSLIAVPILFIGYFIAIDPDSGLLKDLSFGTDVVLMLSIFVISISAILFVEFVPDFFIDIIYGNETDTRIIASGNPEGAGLVMISKSIRILGFCIIIASAIMSLSVN